MHDLKAIRQNPDFYRTAFARRGCEKIMDDILELDEKNRQFVTLSQQYQSLRNSLSKKIGEFKAKKQEDEAQKAMAEVAELKEKLAYVETEQGEIAEKLHHILISHPNILQADVPNGSDETENKEVKKFGDIPQFDFPVLSHDELGKQSGLMDFEKAAQVSGARFVFLKGNYAHLERALTQFMLDTVTNEFGYLEVSPPVLVKNHSLFGTGQLPKFEEDLYKTSVDDYLIPTAEVSLTNLVREEILPNDAFPLRFTAGTLCFRSEAGSAGRDTKGIIRQHQFIKVELVSIVPPEMSEIEHERMTNCAESILEKLGLAYRRLLLCSGDTGFSAQKTYDLEVWIPSQNQYREISSCSNCGDFQARRMNARYKNKEGQNIFVHTLNGSCLAVGRTMVAILENYQQQDGSVKIPEVLKAYMGNQEYI